MSCQQKSQSMNWLFQLFQIKVNIAGLSISAWRHGKVSAQGYFGNVNLPAQRRYNTEIFQYHGHGYVTVALLKTDVLLPVPKRPRAKMYMASKCLYTGTSTEPNCLCLNVHGSKRYTCSNVCQNVSCRNARCRKKLKL